ncbi:hypothetical protein KO525_04970 [Psychrosphaera sp. B3R10]|uniref:Transposase n=1 Tax=Psychrosphaera algicola TaxID=3023714 RepID=A0ABT5FA97_9GAMM|nr:MULTISPECIES: hypothetical protein [unclassified Psychrosphaera]MBU2883864.1 hypothetical protein [Psychrosphaera sp. I2R16]MBU2988727.1 hypothetical protein [Psychrosphaera sp. B3R10]MDC2888450.1 hypothetical protein [Psychrosphaera sp. G1-22]MDO6718585.1 hypothetical protein [Psychrosphaera sp. 1_MG-2023]
MSLFNEEIRIKIMSAVRYENRLIGDVSDEFGVSRKQIFDWLKTAERIDKRTKALKQSGIKRRMEKLNKELESLNLV